MIKVRHIIDGAVNPSTPDTALQLIADGCEGVLWVDLTGQGQDVLDFLAGMNLEEWIVEDMLQTSTYPKAEAWPNALFLVVSGLDLDTTAEKFELATMEIDAVLGDGWMLTHTDRPLELMDRAAVMLERDPTAAPTPAQMLHLLLDTMVDEYEPFVDVFIPERLDLVEEALFNGEAEPAIRAEIYLRRRDVQRLERVARPQTAAVRRLAALAEDRGLGEEHLFHDIADRLAYVAAQTDSLRSQLNASFDHYQALVAHSQNEIMKVLTMVSATLLPITVIAGIYGMNFHFMPELNQRWGYPASLAAMGLVILASFLFFRSKGWVGRSRRSEGLPGSLQMTVDRVLRTPALGARVVTRSANAVGRRAWRVGRRAGRLVRGQPPR